MELKGKRAIVTGSTKGIGLAIAESLLAKGAHVLISARTASQVEETVQRLSEIEGGRARGKACDVGDSNQVRELVQYCLEHLGGLEILINNAGIGLFKRAAEIIPQEWDNLIRTNLNGVFYASHFAIPEMKKSGQGFIINISSLAGKNAFPGGTAYNASKFALTGFSEALMQEVRHDGIQVAYVMPGSVDSWFSGNPPAGSSWKLSAQDVADVVIDTLERHPRCLTSRIEMRPSRPPKK